MHPTSLLRWPDGVARLGVLLCVTLTVAFSLVYAVRAIDRFGDRARENAATNFDDREFAGGNAVIDDQAILYEARALIPEDDTYRVLTGSRLTPKATLLEEHIEAFARYFLMPRRPAVDANWVLCFGCDLRVLANRFDTRWQDPSGRLAVVRLAS